MRTLVTGGIRSGKSGYAESLLHRVPGVTYVATGPQLDDTDWRSRVEAHRAARPASWRTVETTDLADALGTLDGPLLVDDLGNWLTATLDRLDAWTSASWRPAFREAVDAFASALESRPDDVVLVSNEVGFSLVSEHRSGRIFADELGRLNQRVAGLCQRVVLVVSGCPVVVKDVR